MSAPRPPRDADGRLPSEAVVSEEIWDRAFSLGRAAIIEAAAELADRGYIVVPIALVRDGYRCEKRPLVRWSRLRDPFAGLHAFAYRAIDPSQRLPVDEVAVVLDRSGLLVADEDDGDFLALVNNTETLGDPGIIECTSRGHHAIWQLPPGIGPHAVDGIWIAGGVQLRTRGLIVIATAACANYSRSKYAAEHGFKLLDEIEKAELPVADADGLRALLASPQAAPRRQREPGDRKDRGDGRAGQQTGHAPGGSGKGGATERPELVVRIDRAGCDPTAASMKVRRARAAFAAGRPDLIGEGDRNSYLLYVTMGSGHSEAEVANRRMAGAQLDRSEVREIGRKARRYRDEAPEGGRRNNVRRSGALRWFRWLWANLKPGGRVVVPSAKTCARRRWNRELLVQLVEQFLAWGFLRPLGRPDANGCHARFAVTAAAFAKPKVGRGRPPSRTPQGMPGQGAESGSRTRGGGWSWRSEEHRAQAPPP